jgi:thioredoxin reductase (NADPH)
MVLARDVVGFEQRGPVRAVLLAGGGEIEARAVLLTTGVSYRRLDADGLEELGARGVYYGATASEAAQCQGEEVYVVGAANSAGQAVLNLSRFARKVVLLVRGERLEDSMSHYLVARIHETENVEVRLQTEVVGGGGDGHLERLQLCDSQTGRIDEVETSWLFVFIGAAPRTDWLGAELARDDKGFLLTGSELLTTEHPAGKTHWPLDRPPYVLETSVPGVFAAGDVRLDSMKRVASAVGEGAMAVHLVHRYLATV